jgi:hypothetical protein
MGWVYRMIFGMKSGGLKRNIENEIESKIRMAFRVFNEQLQKVYALIGHHKKRLGQKIKANKEKSKLKAKAKLREKGEELKEAAVEKLEEGEIRLERKKRHHRHREAIAEREVIRTTETTTVSAPSLIPTGETTSTTIPAVVTTEFPIKEREVEKVRVIQLTPTVVTTKATPTSYTYEVPPPPSLSSFTQNVPNYREETVTSAPYSALPVFEPSPPFQSTRLDLYPPTISTAKIPPVGDADSRFNKAKVVQEIHQRSEGRTF